MKSRSASGYGNIMTKTPTRHFFYYWFPVLFYCLIIFAQSSYPAPKKTPDLPCMDKLLHFAGYALLGILFLRGFRSSTLKNNNGLIMVASILLTGIYGASDELHQYFVPYRFADIGDILADFLGGLFGVYIYQLLLNKYPRLGRI